jgi:hypothetical protein
MALCVLVGGTAVGAAGTARERPLRFQKLVVVDPVGGNIEAFRMLVPAGWIWKGGVVWNLNYASLASVAMRVRNPRGAEAVESFPLIPQVWNEGTYLGPEGGNYLGMEVRRPLSAVALLERLVIPALRGGQDPRVVRELPLPRVARALANGSGRAATSSTYDAARVRITYAENGRVVDEDFYTAVSYTKSPILPGATLWQPQFLYSFKAAHGQLDRKSRLLQAIVASVRPSLRWYAGYAQIADLWLKGQMQSIRAAGELSKTIAAASNSISRSTSQAWKSQQDVYDRVYDRASEQIRGVETYENPFEGRPVQLPSDYGYAWVSAKGEYALSNDAGFNPSVGSTIDWRLLRTAP